VPVGTPAESPEDVPFDLLDVPLEYATDSWDPGRGFGGGEQLRTMLREPSTYRPPDRHHREIQVDGRQCRSKRIGFRRDESFHMSIRVLVTSGRVRLPKDGSQKPVRFTLEPWRAPDFLVAVEKATHAALVSCNVQPKIEDRCAVGDPSN